MEDIFPQSRELIGIIGNHGWTLYDAKLSLSEMERAGPVEQPEMGKAYGILQRPADGQTLEEAANLCQSYPCLLIDYPLDDPRWIPVSLTRKPRGNYFVTTHISFQKSHLYVFSIAPEFDDKFALEYDSVIETFERCFRIVPMHELGLIHMPIPRGVERN